MAARLPHPSTPQRTKPAGRPLPQGRSRLAWIALLSGCLLMVGCEKKPSAESMRIDQLELKIQQLEKRLNKMPLTTLDTADRAGKPPAGVIKSLTLRTGTEDDRLRIYWADGSRTDLPCTKEQATFICG